jgi:hypothetical protein
VAGDAGVQTELSGPGATGPDERGGVHRLHVEANGHRTHRRDEQWPVGVRGSRDRGSHAAQTDGRRRTASRSPVSSNLRRKEHGVWPAPSAVAGDLPGCLGAARASRRGRGPFRAPHPPRRAGRAEAALLVDSTTHAWRSASSVLDVCTRFATRVSGNRSRLARRLHTVSTHSPRAMHTGPRSMDMARHPGAGAIHQCRASGADWAGAPPIARPNPHAPPSSSDTAAAAPTPATRTSP